MTRTLLAAMAAASLAAAAPPPGTTTAAASASPLEAVNSRLPSWVRFSGEERVREEGFLGKGFTEGQDDMYLLQRVRLGITLKPRSWLEMFAQGQDSRVFFENRIPAAPPYQDSVDLRQAWVQLGGGGERHRLTLRAGRQELAFGEERLVGASNWGNVARTFDAVRLGFREGNYGADVFASSVVAAQDHVFDRHVQGDNLHGIWGSIDGWIPRAKLEPFAFWRLSPSATLDSKTVGVSWAGDLPARMSYTMEAAAQRGTRATQDVSAWAGFWRLSRTFDSLRWKPVLRFETNHASGDRDPRDGRHGTFDVLYPTPHDKYGLADQVGWKNIHQVSAIAELKPRKSLILQLKVHSSWLASARDGLYNAGGVLLVRDATGQSGTYVGEELDVQTLWTMRPGLQFGAGLGHLFPGEFLQHTTPGHGYTFPRVGLTCAF